MDAVESINAMQLAALVRNEKALVVDARTFCEYNTCHVFNSINVWCSKLRKKRLQQNAVSVLDFLEQASQVALQPKSIEEIVVYDQSWQGGSTVNPDSFLFVLLQKLTKEFKKIYLLTGGFLEFQSLYPELCEDSSQKLCSLTSLSQPCMPVAKSGPTRILPFLFLGSQHDANNKQMLTELNILYELNVSTSCVKPEFLQDSHFLRIPVNDSFSEKLLPHFPDAFRFIDKGREAGGRVLVHCLAGISRSATVAIAYVMKHLRLHYDEAYRYVKNRRPTISPNINFVGQLLELDRQLLGEGSLYRSPTAPLYLLDHDFSSNEMLPSPEALVMKSSSSSSLQANKKELIFSPKRSLPSLKLEDPDSSSLPSLSFLSCLHKDSRYTSNRLPSSPVSTPPGSPVLEKPNGKYPDSVLGSVKLRKVDRLKNVEFKSRRLCRTLSSDNQTLVESNRLNTPPSRFSDKAKARNSENYSTTALINVKCPSEVDKGRKSICVIEVTHEKSPVTFVHEDPKPIIVRETPVLATPKENITPKSKEDKSREKEFNIPISSRKMPNKIEKSNSLPTSKSKPPIVVSTSSSDKSTHSITSIPVSPSKGGHLSKRIQPKHLPRSYSSSETHLNTRKLLESHSAAAPETRARKSFSTDEMSRVWSTQHSSSQPPCQTAVPFARGEDSLTLSPCDLARCDSWSTSGLGSEISDADSLQGDPIGPYDTVFADAYPGDGTEIYPRLGADSSLYPRIGSPKDQDGEMKHLRQRKMMKNSRPPHCSLSHKTQANNKDTIGGTTPRPVSLPGVARAFSTSQLKTTLDHGSSIDMGVDMDLSPDWLTVDKEMTKSTSRNPALGSSLTEHPPVSPKTMGEDVKHMMTWFKIEPWQPQPSSSKVGKEAHSATNRSNGENGTPKSETHSPDAKNVDRESRQADNINNEKLKEFIKSEAEKEVSSSPPGVPCKFPGETLEERWQWWDNEFKRKIRSIQKHVSLKTWGEGSATDEASKDNFKSRNKNFAGLHLAQELMQSMEDLLESEISNIKHQADVLRSRYGLKMTSNYKQTLEDNSEDKLSSVQSLKRCPLLQNGNRASINLPVRYSIPEFPTAAALKPTASSTGSHNPRAKSEPPIRCEEGLYRVRSCPGLREKTDTAKDKFTKGTFCVALRPRHHQTHPPKEVNRYSCGTLDVPSRVPIDAQSRVLPSFESCPDISELRLLILDNTSTATSSGTSCSSSHSSSRLLPVS